MDHPTMHDESLGNKTEFGFDSKPPTVPAVTNKYDAPLGIRADGNSAAPAADSMSDDTTSVPDPSNPSVGLVREPFQNDISGQWGTVKKGTTGLNFWNTSGRSTSRNSDALGG